jgi:hypothetical protein
VNLLAKLKEHKPHLYERAIELNKQDNFVMWNERKKYAKDFMTKEELKNYKEEEN